MPSRKWKPSRRERRVLVVLMTGAPGLSGYPISRLAQVGTGTVYLVLDKLEDRGWVTGTWEERDDGKPRRRYYHLTPPGRSAVTRLLGMAGAGDA